ncbi:MAG TPA: hypothetical protein PK569_22660 [Thermoanaerobaculia bacterium]|nr:hypothetical protein [Thermoanaerobaculia bacterium]
MPGDRVTAEGGGDVEFAHSREARVVRVVPQKTAILALIGGLVTGGGGTSAAAHFMLKAFIQQEISAHDRDREAHAPLRFTLDRYDQGRIVDDAEKARLQLQLNELSRDVRETREAVIRLEAQLRRGGR